jgi:hypothetical protein
VSIIKITDVPVQENARKPVANVREGVVVALAAIFSAAIKPSKNKSQNWKTI